MSNGGNLQTVWYVKYVKVPSHPSASTIDLLSESWRNYFYVCCSLKT